MKVLGFVFLSLFVMYSCGAMNDAERGVESAMQRVEEFSLGLRVLKLHDELVSMQNYCKHRTYDC